MAKKAKNETVLNETTTVPTVGTTDETTTAPPNGKGDVQDPMTAEGNVQYNLNRINLSILKLEKQLKNIEKDVSKIEDLLEDVVKIEDLLEKYLPTPNNYQGVVVDRGGQVLVVYKDGDTNHDGHTSIEEAVDVAKNYIIEHELGDRYRAGVISVW